MQVPNAHAFFLVKAVPFDPIFVLSFSVHHNLARISGPNRRAAPARHERHGQPERCRWRRRYRLRKRQSTALYCSIPLIAGVQCCRQFGRLRRRCSVHCVAAAQRRSAAPPKSAVDVGGGAAAAADGDAIVGGAAVGGDGLERLPRDVQPAASASGAAAAAASRCSGEQRCGWRGAGRIPGVK